MLTKRIACIAVLAAALLAAGNTLCVPRRPRRPRSGWGTYNSRAVALALRARSELISVPYEEWKRESDAAEEKGATRRGLTRSRRRQKPFRTLRHMQFFGNAPIHDMLRSPHLKEKRRPGGGRRRGLQLVTRRDRSCVSGPGGRVGRHHRGTGRVLQADQEDAGDHRSDEGVRPDTAGAFPHRL